MPGGLDGFLNIAIPIAVFFFFGFMVYKNFKPEMDAFFHWVSEKIRRRDENNPPYQIYSNPYLGNEVIVYK